MFKDENVVQTSFLAIQAMIISAVWVNIIKILTGRERPIADYTFSKSERGRWYGLFAMYDQDLAIRKPVSEFDAFHPVKLLQHFQLQQYLHLNIKIEQLFPSFAIQQLL